MEGQRDAGEGPDRWVGRRKLRRGPKARRRNTDRRSRGSAARREEKRGEERGKEGRRESLRGRGGRGPGCALRLGRGPARTPFPFLRAPAGAPVRQAAPLFAASCARLLRSFAVRPVARSRNVLYALIVSVAMWSATPIFIDVSTKSFFPSVHATIFSRAP